MFSQRGPRSDRPRSRTRPWRPQRWRQWGAVGESYRLELAMRDRRDPKTLGDRHHGAPLAAAGQREIKSHDASVLGADAGTVRLDSSPHDDCAADQIPRESRGRARTRFLRGVDAARALWGSRFDRIVVAGDTASGHLRRHPRRRAEHRCQFSVDQPPMTKADNRLDQIGRKLHPERSIERSRSQRPPGAAPSRSCRRNVRPGAFPCEHAVKSRQGLEHARHSPPRCPASLDPVLKAAKPDVALLELGDRRDEITQRAAQAIKPAYHEAITPVA